MISEYISVKENINIDQLLRVLRIRINLILNNKQYESTKSYTHCKQDFKNINIPHFFIY